MTMDEIEKKKELAKLKRKTSEIAGQIHDIVEESLMTDYNQLPELSKEIVEACNAYKSFKKQNGL
ncbi:MAG: hypothetical protein HQK84_03800 [Nitrospinae bacterium]|nr:hypothetical protein [Nitrospinota bacterium]